MEDVKKNIAALFNSRPAKRYAPRKKRPSFKGYISLNFLDMPSGSQDSLQENEYISLDILEIPNADLNKNDNKNDKYIPIDITDKPTPSLEKKRHPTVDILNKGSKKYLPEKTKKDEQYISLTLFDKKPRKQKCEHLSPVMDCFAGGFGHIRCFDQDFHETCQFKLNHKKMLADREQIRSNLEKFSAL